VIALKQLRKGKEGRFGCRRRKKEENKRGGRGERKGHALVASMERGHEGGKEKGKERTFHPKRKRRGSLSGE